MVWIIHFHFNSLLCCSKEMFLSLHKGKRKLRVPMCAHYSKIRITDLVNKLYITTHIVEFSCTISIFKGLLDAITKFCLRILNEKKILIFGLKFSKFYIRGKPVKFQINHMLLLFSIFLIRNLSCT